MVAIRDWLAAALVRQKKGKSELGRATGLSPSMVSKILSGDRQIGAVELVAIEQFLGERWADLSTYETEVVDKKMVPAPLPVPIIGFVAAGVWRETSLEGRGNMKQDENPYPPDPRFPLKSQYDLIVEGLSLNRVAPDGFRLRCVDVMEAGLAIRDGDLVIVRRTRGSMMVETTAKRLRITQAGQELWPDSTDPLWQTPLKLDEIDHESHDEVRIVAIVIHVHAPATHRHFP